MSEMRKLEDPVRRVVIAGGGNIGFRLAAALEQTNQVKIIERSAPGARHIRASRNGLAKSIVLHGDAADEELLLEENIDSSDIFVAVTNAEEANILSAMVAKQLGCKKVMALINRPSYAELVESRRHRRRDIAAADHDRFGARPRAPRRRRQGSLAATWAARKPSKPYRTARRKESKVVGRAIEDINLPPGVLSINAIVRGDQVMQAHHDTVVESEDHVILFITDRRQTDEVEKLFQVVSVVLSEPPPCICDGRSKNPRIAADAVQHEHAAAGGSVVLVRLRRFRRGVSCPASPSR